MPNIVGARQMLAALLAVCFLVVGCGRGVAALPEVARDAPPPVVAVEFPRDAQPHDVLTEWWYYTGHLRSDADGRDFGFEFTVFQGRRQGAPTGYLAHFAVSDIDGQYFAHDAHFAQGQSASAFPIEVDGWALDSGVGGDAITAAMNGFALQLQLTDEKPPALHHGGYFDYGPPGGSYYYSRTRLRATGELNGQDVSGVAWMDHQWGNFVVSSDLIWDWYSLQLDDRTEYMLYVLRGAADSTPTVIGTRIAADGSTTDLPPGTVRSEAISSWTSPHTGGVYPSGWRIQLPDGAGLDVTPLLLDQELYFPDAGRSTFGSMAYWEGTVRVSGDRSGVGYVELTGYAGR